MPGVKGVLPFPPPVVMPRLRWARLHAAGINEIDFVAAYHQRLFFTTIFCASPSYLPRAFAISEERVDATLTFTTYFRAEYTNAHARRLAITGRRRAGCGDFRMGLISY